MTKPLWRVMEQAYRAPVESAVDGPLYAAEIRAIAEAMPGNIWSADGIHNWLQVEADRAEAGE